MAEGLDFGALWPVPAGRFGWTARGNAPCLMEIVSWLTIGAIDTAWPGVSRFIVEYVQAAQDAMDDETRQKLLVLVPGLIRCSGDADAPGIESARRLLLAQRSLSLPVPSSSRPQGGRRKPRRCAVPEVLLRAFEAPFARPPNVPRRTLS
jgi:hypothetical protein